MFPKNMELPDHFNSEYRKNFLKENELKMKAWRDAQSEIVVKDGLLLNKFAAKRQKGKKLFFAHPTH